MNITKFKFIAAFALGCAMLSLGSCNESDPVSKDTMQIRVSNYIVPSNPTKEVTVQNNCIYSMAFDNVNKTMILSTTDLALPDGSAVSFTSDKMTFENYRYQDSWSYDFHNGTASVAGGNNVDRLWGYVTNMTNSMSPVGDEFDNTIICPMLLASYRIGDYEVRTFSPNSYFSGETTTNFTMPNGAGGATEQIYKTSDAIYRVNFANDMKTVNVVIYNAKFSANMPAMQAIVLRSLPVELTRDGYRVNVTDVIPEMVEGGTYTPNPSKIFSKFTLESSADLNHITCDYVVANMFKGAFSGICYDYFTPKVE